MLAILLRHHCVDDASDINEDLQFAILPIDAV